MSATMPWRPLKGPPSQCGKNHNRFFPEGCTSQSCSCDTLVGPGPVLSSLAAAEKISMSQKVRVFATCDIGDSSTFCVTRIRPGGLSQARSAAKSLIVEKVKFGIDGLITTLRDPIDAEVFSAGKDTLKVVAQFAVGFDNINRADANRFNIPFTNTADV